MHGILGMVQICPHCFQSEEIFIGLAGRLRTSSGGSCDALYLLRTSHYWLEIVSLMWIGDGIVRAGMCEYETVEIG